ncbi:hypothetical protein J7337_010303 [Fusarium musae]|uniref:Uncharacterized protein n=1 Tax=Fusarium musae TaxID=1042133 RepID=A0A9P8D909_9HYPO|nr:hypothetical protein J7337_010303 [Fusarium musae]KAG9497442.1 hypothetical protein J7337_010303 [Fusarium musae]
MSAIFGSHARDEARQLIEKIAVGHGYIEAAKLNAMPADIRRVVEEALKTNSKSHATATEQATTSKYLPLVEKLAAGNINVVFELLQNADDNQFTRARAACANPGVQFIVTPDMVVVGSNEDGFTDSNVKALCDFGKSTKDGTSGYIGQPDVGFKSVFTIASKVQIESGPYSFYLQHEDGDPGIGMVRPHWTEPPILPSHVKDYEAYGGLFGNRTRIILFLKEQNREDLRNSFISQLWDTPDSVLLFMKNLRSLKITVLGEDNKVQRSKDVVLDRDLFGSGTRITTTKKLGPSQLKTWNRYLVYKSTATGLPANPNRRPAPDSSANTSSAEVTLAFPVDVKGEPIVESQKAFAFMPISETGLSFLIHSDFVADATRQQLVAFSDRNVQIKTAVEDTLVMAVQDLCKKPGTEYKWMRFLRQTNRSTIDPFWLTFGNTLGFKFSSIPLLRTGRGEFSTAASLKRLSADQLDQYGEPLLPDLLQEMYPSSEYESQDLDILCQYGLAYLPDSEVLSRLQSFTERREWETRTYEERDEDWHSRLARLLFKIWNDAQQDGKTCIRHLNIIPLDSEGFRVASYNEEGYPFYDNMIDGIPIPGDLGFPMLLPAATANPDCRKLYEVFGPRKLTFQQVRAKIINMYKDPAQVAKLDLAKSRSHLVFLYRIEPKDMITKEEQEIMVIFDQKLRVKRPKHEYVYLPGEGPVAPGKILNPPFPEGLEPPDVSLVHPAYLEDPPSPSAGHDRTWMQWLFFILYCEEKIQLFSVRDPPAEADKTYSLEYKFLVKAYPGLTLHRLMLNFQKPEVKKQWVDDKKGTALMKRMEFLCTDGVRHPLEETLLPLPKLLQSCEKSFASVDNMPFLKLDEPMKDEDVPAWLELAEHCGIGTEDDTKFTLAMLGSISKATTEMTSDISQAVTELYLKLHSQVPDGSLSATFTVQTQIRNFFSNNKCTLCTPLRPGDDKGSTREQHWANKSACLWVAPEGINVYIPLRSIWSPILTKMEPADRKKLEDFFSKTLSIRDITEHDVLSELRHLSRSLDQTKDYSAVTMELYKILQAQTENLNEINTLIIKQAFRDSPLIYRPGEEAKKWFKASECVFYNKCSSEDEISLESLYPDLSPLFVFFLEVPKLSPSLVYENLQNVGNTAQPIPDLKKLLWSLLDTLVADIASSSVYADKIRDCRVFPVKLPSGEVQSMNAMGDFCINDRPLYAAALKAQANLLDFSVEEIHRLSPVIEWLSLTKRYLSNIVAEKTSVDESQGTEDMVIAHDIASKSAALAMISSHFSDGKPTVRNYNLQDTIRKVEVFRHPDIKTSITWYHGFKVITVPLAKSGMHFKSALFAKWQFYIPEDDDDRDYCMATEFPRMFAAQLLDSPLRTVNPQAVMITASVLRAKPYNVGRILQHHGICEAGTLPEYTPEPPRTPERRRDNAAPSPSPSPHSVIRSPVPAVSAAQVIRDATTPYQALLIQAVNVARISTFPHKNSVFDMAAISQSLAESTARSGLFRFYVGDQTEWQRMVGAAGELYVFELLSTLPNALPGWSRDNWQSTVRHHASIHPDYNSLGNWYGTEQGDLFFDDVTGTFTSFLIDKGYLEDSWRKERPEYYIEVKTTTSARLDTPFYMSKHQCSRLVKV